jgi:translocation and assembly module TamB
VGVVVLAVIGSVALLIGGVWTFLQTRWGGEVLRKVVVTQANRRLAGQLAIGRLAFGGDRLALERVSLRDPEGTPVARIARVDVTFSPLALLRRHLDIGALVIDRPELTLAADDRGLNLARAVAPRTAPRATAEKKRQAPAADEDGSLAIDVRRLVLTGGRIDYRSDGEARAHLRALSVRGSFRQARDLLAADAAIDAQGGHLDLRASLDPAHHRTRGDGVTIRARGIDAAALLEGAPASDLGFQLRAHGGGTELAALDGALDFYLPPGKLDGGAVGPIGITVRGRRGRYDLAHMLAVLPGVRATGNGTIDRVGDREGRGEKPREDLDVHVRVEATDLGALARALTGHDRKPPIALAGNGRVDVALGGTLAAPSVRVAAQVPFLAVGANRVQALTASVDVPDLRVPEAANVDVRAPQVTVGGQTLRALSVWLQGTGPQISGSAHVAAPYPLALSLRAERPHPHSRRIVLRALSLKYPEASWSLAAPATIQLGSDRLLVQGLALRADHQLIRIDAEKTDRRVDVDARIAALDLGRLPRALVPARLGVGGMLDVQLRLAGPTAAPRIDLTTALAGGRVRGYRNLALRADVHKSGTRAHGSLDVHALGTAASARFDLPAGWPPKRRERRAPLRFDLLVADTDLAALQKALHAAAPGASAAGGGPPLRGIAHLQVHLDGSADNPRLGVEAGVRRFAAGKQAIGDVTLAVDANQDQPIHALLRVADTVRLDAKTPLSLRSIARQPPRAAALLRTSFDVSGNIQRLPLASVAQLLGDRLPPPVGGTISADIALSGTADDPRGKLAVDLAGASSGRFPATDGRLELALDAKAIEARVRVVRQGHPLLAAVASLGAGLDTLRAAPAALADARVSVRAVVGPLSMQRLGLPPENDRAPPRALAGQLHADLTVDGTMRAPRLLAHVQASDVRLDKAVVGAAQLTARYDDQRASLDALLTSANKGQLHATVATIADLGYPAVTHGLDVRHLPLHARLDAHQFDLAGFSGVTEDVRTVAGKLDADVAVDGAVGNPKVSGRLDLKDGALAIYGLGDYRAIHVALHGDGEKLTLDELAAQSGGGKVRVTGDAVHAGARGYQIDTRASLDKFPIHKEGQPLATVSLEGGITGTVSPLKTRLQVDVQETRIELSDAKRKNLQSLAAPDDVILVENGRPVNRAQAKRLRELEASRAAERARAEAAAQAAAAPPTQKEPSESHARIRVAVNAQRRIWLTGKDAYIEVGLTPGFRVMVNDEVGIFGAVTVYRGRINVLGRRFDLMADSTVQFSGPPDRPQLDVRAQYKSFAENVTVVLTAKGTMDNLKVTVSAPERPELNESQLYTLIITGHLQFGEASGAPTTPANEAASLLGGVIASQLQRTLANKLPLDVLTIDAGSGTNLTGTQLEAGRYMTRRLYVGYVGRVGADPTRYENRNAVHIEYQLSARWQIAGEYGDVGTGTADLMWKKNY